MRSRHVCDSSIIFDTLVYAGMSESYLHRVRKEIREMMPYQPSSARFVVKLDAMENPYSLPQALREGWNAALTGCEVNRYPDATASPLQKSLAAYAGVPSMCRLLLGNGSDELIQLLALALAREGAYLLSPEPSFAIYRMAATVVGMNYLAAPLDREDFSLNKEQILRQVERYEPALICFAQPNNPTGNLWSYDDIEAIIRRAPGYVLLDEAYVSFAGQSRMFLLKKYTNLLVLRTFSKIGFAGMRLGFLVGHDEIIEHLNKLRLPYNINAFTQCGAQFILDNFAPIQYQIDRICRSRAILFEALRDIPGVTPFPSHTNFILLRVANGCAATVFSHLKQRGILVKDLSATAGLTDYLRVTVGTDQENRTFVDALCKILKTRLDDD